MKALNWYQKIRLYRTANKVCIIKGLDWIQIAKRKGEHEKLKYYASGIQKLQRELIDAGIISPQSLSKFPSLDIGEK
jgi:hypothetical protein